MNTTEIDNAVLSELIKATNSYRLQRSITAARLRERMEVIPEPDPEHIRTLDSILCNHQDMLNNGEVPQEAYRYLDSIESGNIKSKFVNRIIIGCGMIGIGIYILMEYLR